MKALNYKLNIKCKNQKQKEFLENLKDKKDTFKFLSLTNELQGIGVLTNESTKDNIESFNKCI